MVAFNTSWYARHPLNQGKSEIADFSPLEKDNFRQLWSNITTSGNVVNINEQTLQSDGYFPMVSYR